MGTNYYAEYNKCSCCNRQDTMHIGKSSAGWTFSFRGYRGLNDDVFIKSESDWREFLSKEGVTIVNEYDDDVTLEEFWKLVETKKKSELNHTVECMNSDNEWERKHGMEECWLDSNGNSFSGTEFS